MKFVTIAVAHDYNCPWCWIGIKQMVRLKEQFDIQFDLLGFELMPENLPWDDAPPRPALDSRRPVTPSRMQLAYAASQMEAPPKIQPPKMRTHNALLATEYAKSVGVGFEFAVKLYESHWLNGTNINDVENLVILAHGIVPDPEAMVTSIKSGEFEHLITPFDDDAYNAGVFNVPTFFIGENKYAEQPYMVLEQAIKESLKNE